MSIALQNESGSLVFLDAVVSYSKNYTNSVTEHPVDGSGVISDHVINHNPSIEIIGFISGADFNLGKPSLQDSSQRAVLGVDNIVIDSDIATPILVDYDNAPFNLLPDVIGQFFTESLPTIKNLNETKGSSYTGKSVYLLLERFIKDKSILKLFEFDNGNLLTDKTLDNLEITSLSETETVQNGDAINVRIVLRQISVVDLVSVEVPEDVQKQFKDKAKKKVNRGGQGSTSVDSANIDPERVESTLSHGLGLGN